MQSHFRSAGLAAAAVCLALAACGDKSPAAPPPPPPTLPAFAAVSAGGSHTCALTAAGGDLYCWGRGGAGALGVDSLVSLTVPTKVPGGGFNFSVLSAGAAHTCAVTPAGEGYCWGQGDRGQIGNGKRGGSRTPVLVAGTLGFTTISAGGEHTCALTRAGVIYCWGRDQDAELGNLTVGRDSAAPGAPVADSRTYSAVAAGGHHTCGLTSDGLIRCWGRDANGQLGVDSRDALGSPETVKGGLKFRQLTAGTDFTCGLTTANAAYCWGRNDFGQVGNGGTSDALVPTQVGGGLSFATISAGGSHACALTADGQAYCWGSNSDGQLGSGAVGGLQSAPTAVSGTGRFKAISAGLLHTCALTSDGLVFCWGYGGFGQLGDGHALTSAVPVQVSP